MQKKNPVRCKKHLAFIRSLPCVRCGCNESQAAHIRIASDGGMGMKPGDNYTLPLCHVCHSAQHNIGERSFYKSIEAAHELANALWLLSGDVITAIGLIVRKRRDLF